MISVRTKKNIMLAKEAQAVSSFDQAKTVLDKYHALPVEE
jgi:hypothetical protein